MRYHWGDQSFDLPDGLTDRSVIVLVDESNPGAAFGVSLARDTLAQASDDALSAYVDEVVREASARLHALRVTGREHIRFGTKDTLLLTQTVSSEPGDAVSQHQAFVRDKTAVTIVTVSCSLDAAARARQVVETAVSSMRGQVSE
jgi:hypothetical protein